MNFQICKYCVQNVITLKEQIDMADNKKSFLLYCDVIHTVKKLTNEQAGELFKHILSYVNDENPTGESIITEIAFEPIKQQLKRDLKKYESICDRNKNNGLKGGRPLLKKPKKPSGIITNPEEPKKADIDIDTDTDTDIDIEIEKNTNTNIISPLTPKGVESDKKNWKNDFDVYVEDLRNAYTEIKNDADWIKQQESFYQNVDILKSIEKACVNYWATPTGWKKKKQSRITEINWKSTFGNAISLNKVYKNGNSNLQSTTSFGNTENKQNTRRASPENKREKLRSFGDMAEAILQNS